MNWQSTFSLCWALLRILYPLSQAVTSKPDFKFWDTVYVFTGYRVTVADLVLMVSSIVSTLQSEDLTWLGMFNKGPVKCSQDYKPMDSQYTLVPHCACIGYLSWLTCPLSVHLPSLTIWLLCIALLSLWTLWANRHKDIQVLWRYFWFNDTAFFACWGLHYLQWLGMPGFAENRVQTPNWTEPNLGPVQFRVRVRKDPNFHWGSGLGFTLSKKESQEKVGAQSMYSHLTSPDFWSCFLTAGVRF